MSVTVTPMALKVGAMADRLPSVSGL